MHQLFQLVLGQRDLSRAGDLFSLDDAEIEDCLSQALEEIKTISCHPDYVTNDNDQAVVEICITRITTAIRETSSMERHGPALVALWESCLEHNLHPHGKDEDTPHAKIASDITSCILQNYNRAPMMALAVPVAVRFLQQGNRELSRNMSSYLSLAAITKAELLVQHTQAIIISVLGGNSMLLRVLPSVYPLEPGSVHLHIQDLVLMIPELDQISRQHLLQLLQMISEQHPKALTSVVPSLIGHLSDASLNDGLLAVLVNTAQISPASLITFLPDLRIAGQRTPGLLGHVAKIHGAVGLTSEAQAREALEYLVCVLACMEHSVHHTVLLEIHGLTERYTSIVSGGAKDIYRSSNSFAAIARLLGRRLHADTLPLCRQNSADVEPKKRESDSRNHHENQSLQVKVQTSEEKLEVEDEAKENSPGPQRCSSLDQLEPDEHQDIRLKNPVPRAYPNCIQDGKGELNHESYRIDASCCTETGPVASSDQEELPEHQDTVSHGGQMDFQGRDRIWKHLQDNLEEIRDICADLFTQIPVPEHCVIEDTQQGCVAKLSFSCPMKGHYCLYGKSSFLLCSLQPHLWIHIMLLALQCKADEALKSGDVCVQQLRRLWEKTQLKGAHSFELAMTQTAVPQKKEVNSLHVHLEEVRFFHLFGYSEEHRAWLCFMCNNPEKATVVNRDGQPLIEGTLKEKQVRWKFIKRWKTRYFTLAGNQLLFRKGKSKDEPDNNTTIELSKVQSVKTVARKRREHGLPRAFEIFADDKTYVLKAEDEKHAEEWLQCINVAVAQAKERENREATTYL